MPGKCQQIHGHSMQIELTLHGQPNKNGIFEGLDFGDVKKAFRNYIDTTWDHKLLLHQDDPWTGPLLPELFEVDSGGQRTTEARYLPGLVQCVGDPTTENLAKWIGEWAVNEFKLSVDVYIQETGTNGVGRSFR